MPGGAAFVVYPHLIIKNTVDGAALLYNDMWREYVIEERGIGGDKGYE